MKITTHMSRITVCSSKISCAMMVSGCCRLSLISACARLPPMAVRSRPVRLRAIVLVMIVPSQVLFARLSDGSQLTAERARQRTALLFGQMPPELDLASMRAQRQRDAARSGAVHNHLRPEAIELEAAGPAGFPSFE